MKLEVICIMETFNWNDPSQKDNILTRIRRAPFTTNSEGIILCGLRGAGKSSFINSVQTAMIGRIALPTPQGQCMSTTTTKVSYIKIADLPVTIVDVPGFNREDSSDDLIMRDIMGNMVPDGTELEAWKSGQANGSGDMENATWCVVYVHNCMDTDVLPIEFYNRIRDQGIWARRLGFDMVILLTKIDQLGENEELSEIYIGSRLREVMEVLKRKTGVDVMNIYPVQNYSAEHKTIINMDILLLNAVRCMLDRLEDMKKKKRTTSYNRT
ncbi:interferon-induced protein 44-like [Argopecten irradians]|uniref:interferon-induced protein 44-like n=1 Tax=Argopecten irradians TaxID=31199 RepID=UPI003720F2F6